MSHEFGIVLPNATIMFHVKHDEANTEATACVPKSKAPMFHVKHPELSLLIAGGREPASEWLKKTAQANVSAVYCADKGVKCALEAQASSW